MEFDTKRVLRLRFSCYGDERRMPNRCLPCANQQLVVRLHRKRCTVGHPVL